MPRLRLLPCGRERLLNFIFPVRSHALHDAASTTPPLPLQAHDIRIMARGKGAHRIVTGEISTPADHLLALPRNGAVVKENLRADATRIWFLTFEAHLDAWPNGVIA